MMYTRIISHIVAIAALLVFANSARAQERSDNTPTTILTNLTVIDGTGAAPIEDATVVIEGNRIAAVHHGDYAPEDNARVFDLEGGYLLPGLWNNHVHPSDILPDPKRILGDEPLLTAAIRAGRNLMDSLRRGFTSLRMAGERDYIDVAWRDAFDSGVFVGPRILASGPRLAAPGDWSSSRPLALEFEGPEAAVEAVNTAIKNGADYIKLMLRNLTTEEMTAVIDTAHAAGLRVTGDASEPFAGMAVKLGIDSVEHGDELTDETIALMAAQGTAYDPTVVCNLSAEWIDKREMHIAALGLDEDPSAIAGRIVVAYGDERSHRFSESQRDVLMRANKAGVKITPGSDSNPVGEIGLLEIEMLVLWGLTEMEAITAATRNSAEASGMLDDLGTIESGKIADLIVIKGDPLENISNLRTLRMVFKDGKPVNLTHNEGRASYFDLYYLESDRAEAR